MSGMNPLLNADGAAMASTDAVAAEICAILDHVGSGTLADVYKGYCDYVGGIDGSADAAGTPQSSGAVLHEGGGTGGSQPMSRDSITGLNPTCDALQLNMKKDDHKEYKGGGSALAPLLLARWRGRETMLLRMLQAKFHRNRHNPMATTTTATNPLLSHDGNTCNNGASSACVTVSGNAHDGTKRTADDDDIGTLVDGTHVTTAAVSRIATRELFPQQGRNSQHQIHRPVSTAAALFASASTTPTTAVTRVRSSSSSRSSSGGEDEDDVMSFSSTEYDDDDDGTDKDGTTDGDSDSNDFWDETCDDGYAEPLLGTSTPSLLPPPLSTTSHSPPSGSPRYMRHTVSSVAKRSPHYLISAADAHPTTTMITTTTHTNTVERPHGVNPRCLSVLTSTTGSPPQKFSLPLEGVSYRPLHSSSRSPLQQARSSTDLHHYYHPSRLSNENEGRGGSSASQRKSHVHRPISRHAFRSPSPDSYHPHVHYTRPHYYYQTPDSHLHKTTRATPIRHSTDPKQMSNKKSDHRLHSRTPVTLSLTETAIASNTSRIRGSGDKKNRKNSVASAATILPNHHHSSLQSRTDCTITPIKMMPSEDPPHRHPKQRLDAVAATGQCCDRSTAKVKKDDGDECRVAPSTHEVRRNEMQPSQPTVIISDVEDGPTHSELRQPSQQQQTAVASAIQDHSVVDHSPEGVSQVGVVAIGKDEEERNGEGGRLLTALQSEYTHGQALITRLLEVVDMFQLNY